MDLLRAMAANRQAKGVDVIDPAPAPKKGQKKESKAQKAKRMTAGTREMRHFIIEEKPSKKVVKDHLEAIIARECATSSEED
jgi:hypothetical protein